MHSGHTCIEKKGPGRRAELTSLRAVIDHHSETLVQALCNSSIRTISAHVSPHCFCGAHQDNPAALLSKGMLHAVAESRPSSSMC